MRLRRYSILVKRFNDSYSMIMASEDLKTLARWGRRLDAHDKKGSKLELPNEFYVVAEKVACDWNIRAALKTAKDGMLISEPDAKLQNRLNMVSLALEHYREFDQSAELKRKYTSLIEKYFRRIRRHTGRDDELYNELRSGYQAKLREGMGVQEIFRHSHFFYFVLLQLGGHAFTSIQRENFTEVMVAILGREGAVPVQKKLHAKRPIIAATEEEVAPASAPTAPSS